MIDAQRARGFEPRLGLRLAVPLRERHRFALRLSEGSDGRGAGLDHARALLREGQLVWESLAPGLAMAAAVQIERAGGQVEFELGRIERLAFDPNDPRRGDQACERLTIRGGALVLARGPLARPTELHTLIRRGSASQLFAGFEAERARWAADPRALVEVDDEAELLARVGAREPSLEAALHRARGPTLFDHAEIYGDWLQAHGDPRGLVASASLAAARAQDLGPRAAASAALASLVADHGSHLLGSLAGRLRPGALAWLGPIVARARLDAATIERETPPRILAASAPGTAAADVIELEQLAYVEPLELLGRLLALPVTASLRGLELEDGFAGHPKVFAVIGAAACAPWLEHLRLDGLVDLRLGHPAVAGVAEPLAPFARLRRLAITGVRGELSWAIRLPALRRLELEYVDSWPDLSSSLAGLDAARLTELELGLVDERGALGAGSVVPGLAAMLAQPSFARVRRLSLARRGPPRFEGLAQALASSPAAATLERVDVRRAGLSTAGLAELRQRLPRLELVGP